MKRIKTGSDFSFPIRFNPSDPFDPCSKKIRPTAFSLSPFLPFSLSPFLPFSPSAFPLTPPRVPVLNNAMQKLSIVIALLFVFTLYASSTFAQDGQSGLVKTAKGYLIVWNEPGNYFTLEIKGKNIVPAEEPQMFRVDGKFFQFQTAEKSQFLKNLNDKTLDDKKILTAHRDWERDYAAEILKSELKVDSEWLKLPSGQDVLAWSYDMPKVAAAQTAKKQIFLTAVKRDHVLVLNSALEDERDAKDIRALLLQTLITLRSSDKPLDLQKASQQVMKEN